MYTCARLAMRKNDSCTGHGSSYKQTASTRAWPPFACLCGVCVNANMRCTLMHSVCFGVSEKDMHTCIHACMCLGKGRCMHRCMLAFRYMCAWHAKACMCARDTLPSFVFSSKHLFIRAFTCDRGTQHVKALCMHV
jgi:hypothetical protein